MSSSAQERPAPDRLGSGARPICAAPSTLRELAVAVRQAAEVLEQTGAALVGAGSVAAPAPDPVPRAVELLAADARAALLAEAQALWDVAGALILAADSYAADDHRIAESMGRP
jgi:hypothetical protein